MKVQETRETLEQKARSLIGRHAFTFDRLGHRLLPKRPKLLRQLRHNLCLAADVTVGWGPIATDWEEQRTPFLRRFYRWYWNGECQNCGGKGQLAWVESRQPDGSYLREENVPCWLCGGDGRINAELAADI